MKGRNTLAGLSLLALASCGDVMPKGRTWTGQLTSVPGYNIMVNQRTVGGKVIENTLHIGTEKETYFEGALIYAFDGNGNGKFTDDLDSIKFRQIDSDTNPILIYAHPVKLAQVLNEALPNAINNSAYNK